MTLKQKYNETILGGGLPFEPPYESNRADADASRILRQLWNFYHYGLLEPGTVRGQAAVPALLHPYLNLSSVRHDYPVCLDDQPGMDSVRSLTDVIDELIQQVSASGDEGERLKRHVYQLESVIRTLAETGTGAGTATGAGLMGLWDLAAKSLLGTSQLDKEKQDLLRENLDKARSAIKRDMTVLGCEGDTMERILLTLVSGCWQKRCKDWRKELGSLIQQLQDILDADFNLSPEARSATHLSESSGTADDEIDFGELSLILTTSKQDYRLPTERRKRVEKVLNTLLRIQPLYAVDSKPGSTGQEPPFSIPVICNDSAGAVQCYQEIMQVMADFFRAVNIARLEAGNHYREGVHDVFFNSYGINHLSDAELGLCPPIIFSLRSSGLAGVDCSELLDILNSGTSIKVLLQIDDLTAGTAAPGGLLSWTTRLGNMAITLANGYVMQAPVSRLSALQSGLQEGLEFEGPALFSIYIGNSGQRSGLPVYLDAAATAESRVFPVFNYNPARGDCLRDRLDILGNPQCDRRWTREPFTYRTAAGTETNIELAFTPADFLCCDKQLEGHFWSVPPALWHENMIPLQEFLDLDTDTSRSRIPYLLTVDEEGLINRVVMTRTVVAATLQCAAAWSHLQEIGGINNSFTAFQLSLEKARLETEQQAAIKSLEEQYSRQLDQDLGQLTEEIVQRIAQQLVLGATGVAAGALSVTAREARPVGRTAAPADTTADKTLEPAKTPAVAPDDDEDADTTVSLDAAYIETPRCTTCDECTKLNPQIFVYDSNKQAYIKDAAAGPYKDMVKAAEKCPVKIIHPGKPLNPSEAHLEDLMKRAAPFM